MTSRRDSRGHLVSRQTDALAEFENFKKKYLLVNRHITKLNSTLSVRVEELNAQVSTLYVENLRLRASEISLATQLKRERGRSRRIVLQAEKAVGTLMEQLSGIRGSLGLPTPNATPEGPASPLKRKVPSSPVQPPRDIVRIAKPPADVITLIRESEEEDTDVEDTPTRAAPFRSSTSRLPLPKISIPATVEHPPEVDFSSVSRRKLGRRNSALLVIDNGTVTSAEEASTSADGSSRSLRRKSLEGRRRSLDDEEQEVERAIQGDVDCEADPPSSPLSPLSDEEHEVPVVQPVLLPNIDRKVDRKGKSRLPNGGLDRDENQSASERESSENSSKERDRRRFGIKDVTNSPRRGPTEFMEEKLLKEMQPLSLSLPTTSAVPTSSAVSMTDSEMNSPDKITEVSGGRERRTRKSVNYAEPKLNTKMRKPDSSSDTAKPRSSTSTSRRRKSTPAVATVPASDDEDADADIEGTSNASVRTSAARRKTAHDTSNSAAASRLPTSVSRGGSMAEASGAWGDETRRHSLAI
ncbi:hypothetical protein M422DRAFT_36101 [Sphaerobolus stellatus SS14]|uniref:Unplaced genomic scaffold SPHSTscaffold_161, whole genome shotgun sequence n=1 Tax=Sphaerobolus stellatus (strain SS14) TaxID=990650 RepID=A0A0C9UB85_SPHS4|nr:hypothetical protein M422DRAFT_36101 [Sphaerobolus stellatus SS14]